MQNPGPLNTSKPMVSANSRLDVLTQRYEEVSTLKLAQDLKRFRATASHRCAEQVLAELNTLRSQCGLLPV